MAAKCPKCGGELVRTAPEVGKCKKCGAAFKMRITDTQEKVNNEPKKSNNIEKSISTAKLKKEKKKGGIWKKVIIAVVVLGILGNIFGGNDEKGKKKDNEDSIWATEPTDLEDFEYYVDGDEIYIEKYKGKDDKILIGSSYDIDGKDMNVMSLSGAPFMSSNLESAIVSEGIWNLEKSVFNSCGVKYVYLPSTLENIDDGFWGYFHDVEKLYYGGTQEQWDAICNVTREDLDSKFIYCNVKVDELNEEDSKKDRVSMKRKEDIEAEEQARKEAEKQESKSKISESNETDSKDEGNAKKVDKEMSKSEYKKKCKSLDYEDIMRNPEKNKGKYCVVSGTVDQIIEGWFGSYSIFVLDGAGNKWGCVYSYKENESHVLEGDSVKFYGECAGTDNTETVLGQQVTMPRIDVKYIK